MFFYVRLESGQHVEIVPMFSIALDSRVVNMLGIYRYVPLFWTREWSTCWDSIDTFRYVGLESGQHVEIVFMCLPCWIRELSTC